MLNHIRIWMYVLICTIYMLSARGESIWIIGFMAAGTAVFIWNHIYLVYMPKCRNEQVFWTDLLLSFTFGFLMPGSTLYMISAGVAVITKFLFEANKIKRRLVLLVCLVLWAAVSTYTLKQTGSYDLADNLTSLSFLLFGAIVGDLIRQLSTASGQMQVQYEEVSRSHKALEDANEQLQQYASQVEQLTADRERSRIAGEIHDTVGHKMTALLVQLQLAEEWMKHDGEKAAGVLEVCRELAAASLDEVRFSVHTINTREVPPMDFLRTVRALLEDFYKTAGLQTELKVMGDPSMIPSSLQPAIIRTIQEALTNAKRHGLAERCQVEAVCTKEKMTVAVRDNGLGGEKVQEGFGLRNMKKRIEEHGGTLQYQGKDPHGFEVLAEWPLQQKHRQIGGAEG